MKKINIILIFFFLVTIIFNYFYGSLLYSKITGKEEMYKIGEFCNSSRIDCENKYFKDYLDKIDTLSNESRAFFSNIFIQEDKIGYTGNCPCPYNSDSRGGSCGARSSYSKGGQIRYCYGTDVSDTQIADKRASMVAEAQKNLNNAVQKDLNVYHEKYTLLIIIIIYGVLFFILYKKTYLNKKIVNL